MNFSEEEPQQSSWVLIAVILSVVLAMFLFWKFSFSTDDAEPIQETVIERQQEVAQASSSEEMVDDVVEDTIQEPDFSGTQIIDESVSVPDVVSNVTEEPTEDNVIELDESDSWVQEKLTEIIWRKELLELFINEDMVRRFVVFVDNFAQGNVSYNNSPVVKPLGKFTVKNIDNSEYIDSSNYQRFSRYIELLQAVDVDLLIEKYVEFEPLLKSAYSELGYPDDDFKDKLLEAINKVLDVELPKSKPALIQPSVMYKYEDEELESLDDAEKLMLRIGKENLLVIKSILLEVNEKLVQ